MSLPRLWFETFRWPKAGSELVFVADAAMRVGDALFKPGWRTDPSKAQIAKIAAWIGDRCRDGHLSTRLLTGENKLVDGSSTDWLGNNDATIVRNGFIETPAMIAAKVTGWHVFILRDNLDVELAPLPHAGAAISASELSRYSDHLQFAVGLAKKWEAHRDWNPPKRQVLTDNIRAAWRDTRGSELSPEAAERIGFILKGFQPT